MALQLNGDEFETIRDDFVATDKDGDGHITREEMLEVLEGVKDDKIDYMMKVMDLDCNGSIQFHEFLEIKAFLVYNKGLIEATTRHMFRELDRDGNGFLSAAEIKRYYEVMRDVDLVDLTKYMPSDKDIDELIRSLDHNGDGKIDYKEFLNGIKQF